ncbi:MULTISPECIES: alpha/beta hydrolase [unclassified Streptomyces]|uniref:alpha/beta fold hydrolase n=1 Tax=unclassified Streptomyces TaxID=2593676 RepID=UPI002E10E483|nr:MULTISPECIES: alpha/beta hydrolase [unclassified Streptomyces]WSR23076.1 alpha/beta hydrolase [Streptomyces sp. NBC_01205]
MAQLRADGVKLSYERSGAGEPLVLVHGSWTDHRSWQPAIEAGLEASFTVVAYDRRGHGGSDSVPGQSTRVQDEDDLAALIEGLGDVPAHVAGNSFGASIVLGLAARRPELFRSVIVHEPPLIGVVADDPVLLAGLQPTMTSIDAVMDHLRRGEDGPGARLFVEEIAMGPGTWDQLPTDMQETFVAHAQTWLDEQSDPDWASLDVRGLASCTVPVMLSRGTESPEWFSAVLDRLALAMPQARRNTFEGAGHIPHVTHPGEYAAAVTRFVRET